MSSRVGELLNKYREYFGPTLNQPNWILIQYQNKDKKEFHERIKTLSIDYQTINHMTNLKKQHISRWKRDDIKHGNVLLVIEWWALLSCYVNRSVLLGITDVRPDGDLEPSCRPPGGVGGPGGGGGPPGGGGGGPGGFTGPARPASSSLATPSLARWAPRQRTPPGPSWWSPEAPCYLATKPQNVENA